MPALANPLPDGGLLGFRDVDSAPDPLAYASFLDHFAASFCEMIATGLDLLRLQDGAAVLDLGCGHGAAFPALAARVGASGRIVGIDVSRTLLAEAEKRFGESGLPVQCNLGDAHALPFPAGTFDAARADRVFLFLRDPAVALAELIRVTKPGGRLVVSESDLETAAVDAADDRTTREMLATMAGRLPNGRIGRRLRAMFIDAGLEDVGLRLFPIQSTSYAEWTRRVDAAGALQLAVTLGRVTEAAASAWTEELREREAAGRFLATGTFFMVSGTKPVRGDRAPSP
jgi:ubiquinone/menaquinone biosynthesis C-methylase UbiE